MYTGQMAHTGLGALLLTVVALVLAGAGALMKVVGGRR